MPITKVDFSAYVGKRNGTSALDANEWNTVISTIQNKVNELIDNVGTGGSAGPVGDTKFYVNGEEKVAVDGVVALPGYGEAGYPATGYKLSGYLEGKVTIGTVNNEPLDDTEVELCGLTVKNNDVDNAAIMYLAAKQTLRVTIAKNTVNYLVCSNVASISDSQKGCLWSENNMLVQGAGYLACANMGGHGIKASKLSFNGNPHVYVSAEHDGIHGNGAIDICGGLFYIAKANDAFGTRAESGTLGSADYKAPGKITIFKAEIYAYNVHQNVLDSKAPGYIFGDISIHTSVSSSNVLNGITRVDPAVFFGNAVQDTSAGGYSTQPSGTVKCYTDDTMTLGETEISPVDGVYTLTTKYCRISGYVDGKITTSIASTDISVTGYAYVTGNIEYTNSGKKVGIYVEKDGAILIVGGNIVSNSNLAIEVKSGSYCVVKGAIDGGDLTFTDTKGVVIVNGNVKGKKMYVGTAEKADATKKLWGALVVDGTVKIVLNSKFTKGNIVVSKAGLPGCFCADVIDTASTTDLDGSSHVFYHKNIGIVIGEKTVENNDYITV